MRRVQTVPSICPCCEHPTLWDGIDEWAVCTECDSVIRYNRESYRQYSVDGWSKLAQRLGVPYGVGEA